MRLLLDTHALLWFCAGHASLSDAAKDAIQNQDNERFVSLATAWEVAIKISLGKLQLGIDYDVFFSEFLRANGFSLLPLKLEHYSQLVLLPRHHGDPFDRASIVQAQIEQLQIVTGDPHFAQYEVPVLW
ncbi:MAG: type II toxin-antitoxin system VapC family toxin [Verrucomicrobiota bacterium]